MSLARCIVGIASALALGGGCFAEAPTVGADDTGGGTTDAGSTGTTGADSGETLVADETAADETASAETGEPVCEEALAELFLLPSDIVVGVDPNLPNPADTYAEIQSALEAVLGPGTLPEEQRPHIALVGPSELMFAADCNMGCGRCAPEPESVRVQAAPPMSHPQDVFLPEAGYECVFRVSEPDEEDAHRTYIHVTAEPAPSGPMPAQFLNILEATGAAYNVACPGCDGTRPIEQFAELTGGVTADLAQSGALEDLIRFVGAPRVACLWLPNPPDGYTIDDLSLTLNTTLNGDLELERVPGYEDCAEPPFGDDPELQWTAIGSDDGVDVGVLCPSTCLIAQFEPAFEFGAFEGVSIQQTFCR